MRRITALLALMFLWLGSSLAVTVQVGSGTATSAYLPIRAYYGYTYSQQIYTQAQINTAGTINKIRFYLQSGNPTNSSDWVVYLGHTIKTSFTSTTDWVPLASLTQVFAGTVTFPGTGNWMEITLTTPFSYNNTDNLVVAVDENTPGYADDDVYWLAFTSGSNTGIYYYSDGTNPDPASPPTGTRTSNINQIQFDMATTQPVLLASPPSLAFGYTPFGASSAEQSYVLSGINLTTGPIVVTAPSGFELSLTSGGPYTASVNVSYTPPTLSTTAIYVRFTPTADNTDFSGNITNVGGGASLNVGVTGTSIYGFCSAGSGMCDEYIGQVQVGTIDNSSSCVDGTGYSDYSAISTNMYKNLGYTITVTNPVTYSGDQCGIWVDWNNNCVLNEAGETMTVSGGPSVFTATITPPAGAYEGSIRMRIRITYIGGVDPCGIADYGEVEDYTIIVLPAPTTPVFSIAPSSKNFGNCPLFHFSSEYFTQNFTVQNIGGGVLTISSVSLSGADAADFVLTDLNTYPVGLSGSSTMQVSVKFYPLTVGAKTAALQVQTTEPATYNISLSGTGIYYPPQNLSGQTTPALTNELSWDPPLPDGEIRYDNGVASNWYWVSNPSTSTHYFFTRFTPPVPGNLDYIAILQRGDSGVPPWAEILVCPENGTSNTPDLTAPIATFTNVAVTSLTGEWKVLQLTPAGSLNAGTDYFIVTHWPAGSSTGPYVGTDASTNSGRCGWTSDGTTWNNIALTFIMRAYMSVGRDSYTLSSGLPNPALGGLEVITAVEPKEHEKIKLGKLAKIPVPGIFKDQAGRELLSYSVYRGPNAGSLTEYATGITATQYIDATVDPSTTYFYGVTALHTGNQESILSNIISLTTNCAEFTPPVSQDFEGAFLPNCWSRYIGLLASPSTLTTTTAGWIQDDWRNVTSPLDKAARLNIWTTTVNHWLMTPVIDLGTETYQLEFDLSLNAYATSDPPDLTGADDKFAVVISTDGGETWTSANTLRLWDNAGSPYVYNNINDLGEHVVISLAGYSGLVMIGFYGESTVANADNDLMINNMIIQSEVACPPPSGLSASNITPYSADIGWFDVPPIEPESFFDVFFEVIDNDPTTTGEIVYGIPSPPTTLEPLDPASLYHVQVRTDCGFSLPKIDYFWLAVDEAGEIQDPPMSGGTMDDPLETGLWYQYSQAPGDIDWYNIWFYNDTLDTTRIKKIRMGFWVMPLAAGPSTIYYVVNWSDSTWEGPGFPTPSNELHIQRSPVNGPVMIAGPQWVEMAYTIEDYNPEWVSVDIWGENILIEHVSPMPPPPDSPLAPYWVAGSPGGIIIHECLPETSVSQWSSTLSFTTACISSSVPWVENFDAVTAPAIPICMSVTNDNGDGNQWMTSTAYPKTSPNSMWITYNMTLPMDDWFFSPALNLSPGQYELYFWLSSSGSYVEKLEVKWGTAPNAAGMTNGPVFYNDNITNSGYVEAGAMISVTAAGDYYIGWHGFSDANQWFMYLDNIRLEALYIWTGSSSADWNDGGNWDRGIAPGTSDVVLIPSDPLSNPNRFPSIPNGTTAICYRMRVEPGGTVDVQPGGTLHIMNPGP